MSLPRLLTKDSDFHLAGSLCASPYFCLPVFSLPISLSFPVSLSLPVSSLYLISPSQ